MNSDFRISGYEYGSNKMAPDSIESSLQNSEREKERMSIPSLDNYYKNHKTPYPHRRK